MIPRILILCVLSLSIAVMGSAPASGQAVTGEAWGNNTQGQCNVPLALEDARIIDCGSNFCMALKIDSTMEVWGGSVTNPTPNEDFTAIAGGVGHALGLKSDGSIVCWGDNSFGQCNPPTPNTDFVAIAAGAYFSVGLKADGSLRAWGSDGYGQTNLPDPNEGFIAIATGWDHGLGLKSDGSIVTWGNNSYGQRTVPDPNSGFVAVSGGDFLSMALRADGSIVAWGRNHVGQCDVPEPNEDFVAVATGSKHGLGLKSDGSIVAWGANDWGQITLPDPNTDFLAIAAGGNHSLGLTGYPPEPIIWNIKDVRNDQGLQVFLDWRRSLHDAPGSASPIRQYEIFRRREPNQSLLKVNDPAEDPPDQVSNKAMPPGVWDYVAAVPAHGEQYYHTVVPTLADSNDTDGVVWSRFMVRAATDDPYTFFDSAADSGYSVDNLAPPAPSGLKVHYGTTNLLSWDPCPDPDFTSFNIYRSSVAKADLTGADLVCQTPDNTWTDETGSWGDSYMLVAVDDAGNESEIALAEQVSDVGNHPGLALVSNFRAAPNPCNPRTEIAFRLADRAQVTLRVYDISGRLVRSLLAGETLDPGPQRIPWNGRDNAGRPVASATYYFSIEAGSYAETKSLALIK